MSTMNLEEVRRRLDEIRAAAGDGARAKLLETELHRDALSAIAAGHFAPATLAAAVLETEEIEFA